MKTFLILFTLLALTCFSAPAQTNNTDSDNLDYANFPYWIDMMQDHHANYYETVEAFNTYWKNREITKGTGYNIFKRWEWATQFDIYPDGSRLPKGASS